MRYLLLITMLLSVPAWAQQPSANFPTDPGEARIVDRDALTLWHDDNAVTFYAVLYKSQGKSYLDIYKGPPWQRLHRWAIEFQGEWVDVPDESVLHIDEYDNTLVFHWDTFVGYREGAVSLSLSYDRTTGEFKSSWVD